MVQHQHFQLRVLAEGQVVDGPDLVVAQVQRAQLAEGREVLAVDEREAVVGDAEVGQRREMEKHARRDVAQLVGREVQLRQLGEVLEGRHVRQVDGVLRQVDRLDVVGRVEEVPRQRHEGVGAQVETTEARVRGEDAGEQLR